MTSPMPPRMLLRGTGRERGAALLTAVLIAALATIIAVALADDYQLQFRRTSVMVTSEIAMQYALGAESWAGSILAEDARSDAEGTAVDHRLEAWASSLPPLPVEGGTVEGALEDLHGRFNLNNLLLDSEQPPEQRVYVPQFQRLLENLGVDASTAQSMALKVLDWIDPDRDEEFPGAEDDFYTGLEPPYRPANHLLTHPSELLAVAEFDASLWRALRPYVTALPLALPAGGVGQGGTAINPNTALPIVIESLYPVGTGAGTSIFQRASAQPFDDAGDQDLRLGELAVEGANPYTLQSRFFLLQVRVTIGGTLLTMYSLLERQGETVWTRYRTLNTE